MVIETNIADKICLKTDIKMSSNLHSYVPALEGPNYSDWEAKMQSFLMSVSQWKCVKADAAAPDPILAYRATSSKDEEDTVGMISNQSEINDWYQDAEKALGNICL